MIADVTNEQQGRGDTEAERLRTRLHAGDLRALSRAISLVEGGDAVGRQLTGELIPGERRCVRVGVTGAPGAGKSTLVDQMIRELRAEGKTVAVLAVDPSSPVTGGALLGDRIRMQGFAGDAGVYIRSLASRGALGGISRTMEQVCAVVASAGYDVLIVETVGVGQDAVDVTALADVTVLVLVPGMGDEVQSMKSGVMEVADVYAINKSDRGGAERLEADLLDLQSLSAEARGWTVPIVKTSGLSGTGIQELMHAVWRCREYKELAGMRVPANRAAGITLDHLGIAVRSIAAGRRFYESLGLQVTHEETVEHERVRTAMLPVGETRLELLEPTEDDSTIGRFLARRGEGVHHIALQVPEIDAMFQRLRAEGVRLASDSVRVGAGGHRYFFVHPASTGGALIEIVGSREDPK